MTRTFGSKRSSRCFYLLYIVAALSLVPNSARCEWITEWHQPPYPNFYFLAPPRMPPTNDYLISSGITTTGSITAGIVGFDQFAFSPGSTTFKLLSLPRPVTVTFDTGIFLRDVWVYNGSTLNFQGGTILNVGDKKGKVVLDDSTLNVFKKSLFDINGTSIYAVDAHGQSNVVLFPGSSVYSNVNIRDTSHLEADEATFGIGPISEGLGFHDRSTGMVTDSTIDNLGADGDAILSVVYSSIVGNVQTNGAASVALDRTNVGGSVSAYGKSHITMAGYPDLTLSTIASVLVDQSANISLTRVAVRGSVTAMGIEGYLGFNSIKVDGHLDARGSAQVFGFDYFSADSVTARENARVVINAGKGGMLEVHDSATLVVDGFETTGIRTYGGHLEFANEEILGNVTLFGGEAKLTNVSQIEGSVLVEATAKLDLAGNANVFGNVETSGDAFITGGAVQNAISKFEGFLAINGVLTRGAANASNGGRLLMSDGFITKDLSAVTGGEVIFTGGRVARNLVSAASGVVNMFGGDVSGKALVDQYSTLNYFGGFIHGENFQDPAEPCEGDECELDESGQASLAPQLPSAGFGAGGFDPLTGKIIATGGSIVNIYGTELSTILLDPNYLDPDSGNVFSVYELVGTLADGSSLTGQLMFLQNDSATTYNLLPPPVPEPATVMMAFLAIVGVVGKRQRSA